MIQFEQRSFNSTMFRPKPTVHLAFQNSLLLVATVWGAQEAADRVIQEITQYVEASRGDVEVTSPFKFDPGVGNEANALRVGCMLANEMLLRVLNQSEYQAGVEIFALSSFANMWSWAQVGQPQAFIQRKGFSNLPVATPLDLRTAMGKADLHSPLPQKLLGIESSIAVQYGELSLQKNDQWMLVAAHDLPKEFFTKKIENLETFTNLWIKTHPDYPFWMGQAKYSL